MDIEAIVSGCDKGIQDVVRTLLELGFVTTDSGDGVSKGEDGLPFPHVVVMFDSSELVEQGMANLSMVLENHPEWPVNKIELTVPCDDELTQDEMDACGVALSAEAVESPCHVVFLYGNDVLAPVSQ